MHVYESLDLVPAVLRGLQRIETPRAAPRQSGGDCSGAGTSPPVQVATTWRICTRAAVRVTSRIFSSCKCGYVCVCKFRCMHLHALCVCACVCARLSVCVCAHVLVRVSMSILCVRARVCVCNLCVCACLCVLVYMSMCV